MERYYDLWSFIPDLGLFSTISQFKRYIKTFIGNTFLTIVYVLNLVFCLNYFNDSQLVRW